MKEKASNFHANQIYIFLSMILKNVHLFYTDFNSISIDFPNNLSYFLIHGFHNFKLKNSVSQFYVCYDL